MKPIGATSLTVENHNNQSRPVIENLVFQVIKNNNKPLLSAETCEKLGLIQVNIAPLHSITETNTPLLSREEILSTYKDVFEGLGHIGDASFVVDPECTPVQHCPRRVPVTLHKEVKEKIADLEEKGIIKKETEPTDWISSMVVVAKPNKIRICLDPKDLNKALKRPKYQMPTLDEILPKLNNAKVFTTLDAKDGFYQIVLDEASSKMTTFWTPFGRYRYLRMPFGVNTAPEEFECKLQEKVADLPGVEVLRDDMLVIGYGTTQEEAERNHNDNLKKLLNRAREINLKLNSKKMNLRKTEVKFMGHVISKDGLKPDPEKITAIDNMPKPTCKQEMMSLLGFINYLAKFLPKLAEVSQPLRDLTTKNAQFVWSSQHERAFTEVKRLVSNHPVLKYYDVKEEVTLQCDASEKGLGATLLQNGQPVAFASRTLSPTERRYAQIEKECLAIVFGCQKFAQYISRRAKVTVESDHKPLQSIFKKSLLEAPCRLQRMMLRLQRYNLVVVYKPGPQMYIADHLSRASMPDTGTPDKEFQVFAIELEGIGPLNTIKISSERLGQLQKATEQDPVMQTLKTTILMGWPTERDEVPVHVREFWNYRDELTLHNNGVLFKNQRLIIPKALRSEVTSRIHSSHLGVEACLRKARDLVFWPAMNGEIKEAVTNCSICAEFQAKQQNQPMQTHEIPDRPWSRLATDLFTLHNKEYIVLVDSYSDYVEVSQLKGTTSAALIEFLKELFSRHGIPDILMSDNGPQYTSHEFAEFSKHWEFKHITSSPYHSRSNGKAEAAVKIVKNLFKKAIADEKDPWLALLDYRNTPTEGIKSSPCQRLMSRRTRTLVPVSTNLLYPELVEGVQERLQLRRQKAKSYFDKNTKILPDLDIGQEIRVAGQRKKTWQLGKCLEKLSDRSYVVQTDGETVRRNREDIRPKLNADKTTSTETSLIPEEASTTKPQTPAPSMARRTSARPTKPPARFKDFV
jgi:transposase InsO family protein